jgi:DNA invertase Pin-like site-specific DNA recombinase
LERGHRAFFDRIEGGGPDGWRLHFFILDPSAVAGLKVAGVGECGPGEVAKFDAKEFVTRRLRQLERSGRLNRPNDWWWRFDWFACQNENLWYVFSMIGHIAIYARTSPDCPLCAEDQVELLKTVAAERRWIVAAVFTDRPTSVRGPDRRPGEAALIDAIRNRTIDRVLIWSVCRIGKSLIDLVSFMETCRTAGVSVFMLEQGIDTATSNGMSLLDLTTMMALHLRQSRRDRILRGQAAARSLSIRFGRPRIPTAKIEKAKTFLATGKSLREVARLSGISSSAVGRLKNAMGSMAASI